MSFVTYYAYILPAGQHEAMEGALPEQVQLEDVEGQDASRNLILEASADAGIQYVTTEQITNEHNQQETVQYIVSGTRAFHLIRSFIKYTFLLLSHTG